MVDPLLPVPKFADEALERAYWESQDSAAHVDWNEAKKATFPNLKQSAKSPAFRSGIQRRKNG